MPSLFLFIGCVCIGTNHTVSKIKKVIKEHSVPFFTIFESRWHDMTGYVIDAIVNKDDSQSTLTLVDSIA